VSVTPQEDGVGEQRAADQVIPNSNSWTSPVTTPMATLMRSRVPKKRVSRRISGSPERCQMVCIMATKKSQPDGVEAAAGHQLAVCAPLDDATPDQHQDLVHRPQSRQPVRDHHGRLAPGDVDQVLDEGFSRGPVEMFLGFVKG
jgi:hypothetical protein